MPIKSVLETFQNGVGTGYDLRTIIDNLSTHEIIECIEEYANQFKPQWKYPEKNELPIDKTEVVFISSENKKYIGSYENEMFRFRIPGCEYIFSTVKMWSYFHYPNKP